MVRLSLAALALVAFSSVGFAQQSGTSDREGGKGAASPGPGPSAPGKVKPCGKNKSGTSDRGGGKEKESKSSTDNPGGEMKSGDC